MIVRTHCWVEPTRHEPGGPFVPELRYQIEVEPPGSVERLHKLLTSTDPRQRKRGWRYLEGSALR